MSPRAAREPSVFLIGFMASGKSAVGKKLARLLGRPFVDTDREIELLVRRSVPRIFAEEGEARFRLLEARVVAEVARAAGAVVAVGGGAVLKSGNVVRMRRAGRVVHIDVPLFRLWARARASGLSKRPLLAAADEDASRRRMGELYALRRPLYRRAAHAAVKGDAPAEVVAERIARKLRLRKAA